MQEWTLLPWYEQQTYLEGMLRVRLEQLAGFGVEGASDDRLVQAIAKCLPSEDEETGQGGTGDELSELQGFGLSVRTVSV